MTSGPSIKSILAVAMHILLLGHLFSDWSTQDQLEGKQVKSRNLPVISLPDGPIRRIPSPDGKWILVFECPNECKERKLSIEEAASRKRRPIKEYERSLSISWSPNSQFFFVDDNSGSTDARCYVYEAATLKEIDVEKVILAKDASAQQFLNSGHSYLEAKHWINSHSLLMVLEGHNEGAPPGGFTLRYRVSLNGDVVKLSQHLYK